MDDAKCLVDEEWFFYFRISSSLWKEKLAGFKGTQVIVPINWAFHQVDEFTFDFGENRKEANLSKIVSLAESENKKIIFYLPLTPAPFLPNGGIPEHLKGSLSLNKEGLIHTSLDYEGRVNKIYSFFDKHIYRGFSFFVKNLGEYVKKEKIYSDFWGVNLGKFNDGKFESYLEDHSPIFHKAFGQYIEALREHDKEYSIKTPEEEKVLIDKFHYFILDLYKKVAREGLSSNWEGEFKVSLLGGNTTDFIKRCFNVDQSNNYMSSMKEGIFQGLLPSTILLGENSKSKIFNKQLNDIYTRNYLPQKLDPSLNDDESYNFSLLSFFNLYDSTLKKENLWFNNGLLEFLNHKYKWAYNYFFNEFSYPHFNEEGKVNFLPGEIIDTRIFQNILRCFMEGGKFLIERDNLDEGFIKKLELFVLENSIKVEKLKFFSEIQNITLGEGRILLFEGSSFKKLSKNQKKLFWDKIINTFHLRHLELDLPEEVDFFWNTRAVSPNDIKYREVRRLYLYNTGKNKKNFKVKLRDNVSLIKKSCEDNGIIKMKQQYFEVDLEPSGSVGIDFGIWS